MKCSPIVSTSESLGSVDFLPKSSLSTITETPFADTTAILTFTNEEALQAAYHLERQGYHPLLIQATEGFRFINLAEIRYFVKQFGKDSDIVIPKDVWDTAKQRTEQTYANSRLLPVIQRF
jgi:ATP-dependent DNA helicase RecQ